MKRFDDKKGDTPLNAPYMQTFVDTIAICELDTCLPKNDTRKLQVEGIGIIGLNLLY